MPRKNGGTETPVRDTVVLAMSQKVLRGTAPRAARATASTTATSSGSGWSRRSSCRFRSRKSALPPAICSGLIIIDTGSPGARRTRAKTPIDVSRNTSALVSARRARNLSTGVPPGPLGAGTRWWGLAQRPRGHVEERRGEVARGHEALHPRTVRPQDLRAVQPEVGSALVLDDGRLVVEALACG